MMLEVDGAVNTDLGTDQPRNGKIANTIAAVLGSGKIIMRPLVEKELEIGNPIPDKAGPEQRSDKLRNAPSWSNNRQAKRHSQKNVTDRNVAIDNRVPWFQVTNESNIAFAIAAYQRASQRGEGSRVIIGTELCAREVQALPEETVCARRRSSQQANAISTIGASGTPIAPANIIVTGSVQTAIKSQWSRIVLSARSRNSATTKPNTTMS
jgi:hypothetical protein